MASQDPEIKERRFLPFPRAVFAFVFSKRTVLVLGVTAFLITVVWQVENWRGRERWEQAERAILARGDQLDIRSFVPEEVADKNNAAAHPVFEETKIPSEPNPRWATYPFHRDFGALTERLFGQLPSELLESKAPLDLEVWQRSLRESADVVWPNSDWGTPEEDVLQATSHAGHGIAQVAEAFSRPHCHWFPLHEQLEGNVGKIGQISKITSFNKALARTAFIRALAHLNLQSSGEALNEVLAVIRFSSSTKDDPGLVGLMVGLAMGGEVLRTLPSVLSHRGWKEADLAELGRCLAMKHSFLDLTDRTFCMERAASIHFGRALVRGESWVMDLVDASSQDWKGTAMKSMPDGWLYQNWAAFTERWDESYIRQYDRKTRRLTDPQRIDAHLKWKETVTITPYNFLAADQFPRLANIYRRAAEIQSDWDLCSVQCALERYRRAHGEFPDTLEPLVPQFLAELPHDYVTGDLPRYTVNADGRLNLGTLDWYRTGRDSGLLCSIQIPSPSQP